MAINYISPIDSSELSDIETLVSENVRAEASRAGFTVSTLAEAIGVNKGNVSLKWRGKRPWRLSDIGAISAVLGISPALLVTPPRGGLGGYENAPRITPGGYWLPRLDSNQQPSD